MKPSLFVDSWGWIALANPRETRHIEVRNLYQEETAKGTQIYTTDYVVNEVITFLFSRVGAVKAEPYLTALIQAIRLREIQMLMITPHHFWKTWQMRCKYRNRPTISFTDLASCVMMREQKITRVVTGDQHFAEVGLGFQLLP